MLFHFLTIDSEIIVTDEHRWHLLENKKRESEIAYVFAQFRAAGIEPVLIKGWAAARHYPPGRGRQYNDLDLAVSADDFETAHELAHKPLLAHYRIDLHRELRELDTVPWNELIENSELVETENGTIRVLCPEDHLRVLCVHWLMDGGEFKHKLWDVYHLVDSTRDKFDWELCLSRVSPERREWIECTVGLAHKYLGLDIDGLPFADRARSLPKWLTRTVEKEWARGVVQRPILITLRDPKAFVQQLRKRIPPNPIRAAVDMHSSFYNASPKRNQVGSFFKRLSGTIGRVKLVLFRK